MIVTKRSSLIIVSLYNLKNIPLLLVPFYFILHLDHATKHEGEGHTYNEEGGDTERRGRVTPLVGGIGAGGAPGNSRLVGILDTFFLCVTTPVYLLILTQKTSELLMISSSSLSSLLSSCVVF